MCSKCCGLRRQVSAGAPGRFVRRGGAGGPARSARLGFTLIELLVVVAIIALLISILLPSLSSARESAKATVCAEHLHQIGLALNYYLDESKDMIPFVDGAKAGSGGCVSRESPFRQYHQIFNYWRYMPELDIYRCPAANGKTSAKEKSITNPPLENGAIDSYYAVIRDDERYLRERHLFPLIDPTRDFVDDAAGNQVIPELFTEYWQNDFNSPDPETGRLCIRWPNPHTGSIESVPCVNGGRLSALPSQAEAVMAADAWHAIPRERHKGAKNVLFVDAHVDRMPRKRLIDCAGRAGSSSPVDTDSFGNSPYWTWGLTKFGRIESLDCNGFRGFWDDE